MRQAVFVPNFGPFGDAEALVELAVAAEGAGWDGFFLWDHINWEEGGTRPIVDPWVAMTAIAAATTRLRIGPMITPLPRRRPWKLARETVTLDRFSGGRLNLGVGIGYPPEMEFGAFGEEVEDRARAEMLDEGLEVLDRLWSGERFSFEGKHYTAREVRFEPAPLQQPRIPIWCAGWWPNRKPFRRAARWDGVVPELVGGGTPTPADVREIAAYIGEHRSAPGSFDIALDGETDPGAGELMAEYEAAGVTWWLERIEPEKVTSCQQALERIVAGPAGGAGS